MFGTQRTPEKEIVKVRSFGHSTWYDLDNVKQFETMMENDEPNLDYYSKGYKRMRIEKMFSELSLNEKPIPPSQNKRKDDLYNDQCSDSEWFSIEIQKIHPNEDLTDGDIMPRRKRKRAKKHSPCLSSNNFSKHTHPSKNESLKKSSDMSVPGKAPRIPSESERQSSSDHSEYNKDKSDDTMVSIEIEDKKEESKDEEMDSTNENKPRCIRITIKDDLDQVIFEKNMVINQDNIKIKPFLNLIDEFWDKDSGLSKYKKFFKKALYKKFNIPDYNAIFQDNF